MTHLSTSADTAYPVVFDWRNATPEQACARFRFLDRKFDTDARSPLHHDRRCKRCGAR